MISYIQQDGLAPLRIAFRRAKTKAENISFSTPSIHGSMKKSLFTLFIFTLFILLINTPSASFAATGLKLCAKGSTVSAKAACAKGEKVLTLAGLAALSQSVCLTRYGDAAGNGTVEVSAFCNAGETFISHGAYTNNAIGVIQSAELRIQSDTNTVGGVTYTFVDPTG